MKWIGLFTALCTLGLDPCTADTLPDGATDAKELRLVIGTHKDGAPGTRGLYVCDIDPRTGALGEPRRLLDRDASNTISQQSNKGLLYCAGSSKEGTGQLHALDLETGKPAFSAPLGGLGSCYLSLSPDRSLLFSADIKDGAVSAFRIDQNGRLGKRIAEIALPPAAGHKNFKPHAIVPSPDGRFLFVPDIGGNRLCRFTLKADKPELVFDQATVSENFQGPRHFCFDAEGRTAYLANQTGEAVTVFRYQPKTGELKEIGHEQSLPDDQLQINNHIAEIKIHPSGKFVYVSNRGPNSLTLFHRDAKTGNLSFVECTSSQGDMPWSFAIGPQGKFLYCSNRKSDNIAVYTIDPNRGTLTFTGQTISVPQPACLAIFPSTMHTQN